RTDCLAGAGAVWITVPMNTPVPHAEHAHSRHSPLMSGHCPSACTCSKGSSPPHPGQFPSGCVIGVPPTIAWLLFTAWYMVRLLPILACKSVIPADVAPACRVGRGVVPLRRRLSVDSRGDPAPAAQDPAELHLRPRLPG